MADVTRFSLLASARHRLSIGGQRSTLNSILRATDDAPQRNRCAGYPVIGESRQLRTVAAVHLPTPKRAVAPPADFNMRRCDFDGHLERGMAAIVRRGTAPAGGFGCRTSASPRPKWRATYLFDAEGVLPPRLDWLLASERG